MEGATLHRFHNLLSIADCLCTQKKKIQKSQVALAKGAGSVLGVSCVISGFNYWGIALWAVEPGASCSPYQRPTSGLHPCPEASALA